MAAPGFTVVYSFPYRGHAEEWSQQWHIETAPGDDAAWLTLEGAVLDEIRLCLSSVNDVVRFYGYDDTDNDAVYVHDIEHDGGPLPGEYDVSTFDIAPGDAAAWMRWKTGRLNTRGKPIYLRKYFHGVPLEGGSGGAQDDVETGYRAAMQTCADDFATGVGPLPQLVDPEGNVPAGPQTTSVFVTTRTLKRRGPRPH